MFRLFTDSFGSAVASKKNSKSKEQTPKMQERKMRIRIESRTCLQIYPFY